MASGADFMQVFKAVIEGGFIGAVVNVSCFIPTASDDRNHTTTGVSKPRPLADIARTNWLNKSRSFPTRRGLIFNSIRLKLSLERPLSRTYLNLVLILAAANKKGADSFVSANKQC